MRGIPSLITDIRKKVFTEVARMAYDGGDYTKAEELPYIIVPGDQPLHRESVFLERAIAGERDAPGALRAARIDAVRNGDFKHLSPSNISVKKICQNWGNPYSETPKFGSSTNKMS